MHVWNHTSSSVPFKTKYPSLKKLVKEILSLSIQSGEHSSVRIIVQIKNSNFLLLTLPTYIVTVILQLFFQLIMCHCFFQSLCVYKIYLYHWVAYHKLSCTWERLSESVIPPSFFEICLKSVEKSIEVKKVGLKYCRHNVKCLQCEIPSHNVK